MSVPAGGRTTAATDTEIRPIGGWILGALALLEVAFLVVLPWFHATGGTAFDHAFGSFSITRPATEFPRGWAGVTSAIAAAGVVLDLIVEHVHARIRRTGRAGVHADVQAVLAIVAAAFVAVKFLAHISFAHVGWGFYVIVVNSAAMVVAAFWTGVTLGEPPSAPAVGDVVESAIAGDGLAPAPAPQK